MAQGTIGGDQLLSQAATFNALLPKEGPLAVPVELDFTTNSSILVDFTYQMAQGRISAIQAIVVRNWNNPQVLTIQVQGTNQLLDVPPYADAVLQVLSTNRAKFVISSTGGVVVPAWFVNVPMNPVIIYSPNGGAPVIITGTINVVTPPVAPIAPLATSVAIGGTAVTAFTNTTAPVRILNPQGATEPLFVNIESAAATAETGSTIQLQPGQGITFPPLTGNVSVNAATSGHVFTAYGPAV